jgi:excisionase family DNA binding protein
LISSNDLADRLGVSRATVLRAVAKGRLKPALVTPGGHRRFRAQDVEELGGLLTGDGRSRELISSSEAARLLGVSQQTLNRAVREGRVRPAIVTPGGHRRFQSSDLVESSRKAANGGAP